jgi:5-methylcytosine-specific restriction endonuclease McrA
MSSEKYNDIDNLSSISDITEQTILSDSSEESIQKKIEISKIFDTELNKLNVDALKDKCKEFNITILSKIKKLDLINLLNVEFEKFWSIIYNKKISDLKNICKTLDIKSFNGLKKDALCVQILTHCANKVILNLDIDNQKEIVLDNENVTLEDLEKQKNKIEKKMTEAIEKQRLADLEKQRLADLEKQRLADIETLRLSEIENQRLAEIEKQKQEEKVELKKKKQSIPKNVRVIIWNHYIGEDIIKHKCLCCKKALISNTNFEVGHVISEKNGGTHEINNLRPICFACNHSMGTENMIDFVVKYGLYIG